MAWEKLASVKVGSALGSAVDGTNNGITLLTGAETLKGTPDLTENFGDSSSHSSDGTTVNGWYSSDSDKTFYDGTNNYGRFDFHGQTNSALSFDLQQSGNGGLGTSINSTKWTLRLKFHIITNGSGSSNGSQGYIGIADHDGSATDPPNQDFIGLSLMQNHSLGDRVINGSCNGANPVNFGNSGGRYGTLSLADNTSYYVQITRNGDNCIVEIFSDSGYSNSLFSNTQTISGITGLRYIIFEAQKDSGALTTAYVDDVKFYDNSITKASDTKLGSGAYSYDGSNDYTECGSAGDWTFLHDNTVNTLAFFVKRDGTQASSEPCVIDTQGASASNRGMSIYWTNNSAGTLTCLISDGTGSDTKSVSCGDITDGEWTHIAIVNDGTNLTSYKNGDQHAQTSLSGFTPSGSAPAYTLNIGRNPRSGAYYKGDVDDLSFWRRALTATEIAKLAKNNVAGLGSTADGTISGASQAEGKLGGETGEGNDGADAGSSGAGGGGGAGQAGQGKHGGNGRASSITGSSVTYAGGGGGAHDGSNAGGNGGTGGGGNGGSNNTASTGGTNGLGGGAGGGGNVSGNNATGGSGVVILRFTTSGTSYSTSGSPNVDTTTVSGKTILKYTSSGTFVVSGGSPDVEYLVVAGGGGSMTNWGHSGGAGAGGMKEGTKSSMSNATYTVTVGSGGASGSGSGMPSKGGNSVFSDITSEGGGYGGNWYSGSTNTGGNGGSGGGGQTNYAGGSGNGSTGSYSFDGSNDYVSIDDSSANLIQGRSASWTIAGWLKRDGSTDKYFISQWGKNSSPDNRVFHIGIDSNGKLLYRQRTDGGQGASFTSNGAIANNTWTHFAIVWQPNGSNWQAQMYINGTADNSKTDFANDMRGGSIAEPVYLGKNGSDATAPSAGGDHFNGELDDLAVWHRALTATEIGKLANNNDSPFTHTGDQNSYGTTSIANNSLVLDSNSGSGQTASPVAVRDLGTLGSSWCVRWSVYAPTQSESISGKNSFARFGFSDKGTYSSSEGLNNVTDKAILWNWHLGTSLLKNMTYTGGSGTNNGGQSISYADDTTWYWEMKYDGSTVTITRYNSDYSSAQVTADTISVSGYTGMNYLVIGQPRDHANGTWKLRFDNIKIWNNQSSATGDPDFTFEFDNNTDGGDAQLVSSLSNTAGLKVYYPLDSNANNSATAGEGQLTTSLADQTKLSAYYNMDTAPSGAELDDDFSSYANQSSADTSWASSDTAKCRVNITDNDIDFNSTEDDSNDCIVYDLGSALSNTKWLCRFKFNISTASNSGLGPGQDRHQVSIGMFDKDQTAPYNTAPAKAGIMLQLHLDRDGSDRTYFSRQVSANNLDGAGQSGYNNFSTGTDYYCEIKRESSTNATMTIRTGSHSGSTALGTPRTLTNCSGVDDLRYFGIRCSQWGYGGQITGTVDDVQVWDDTNTPIDSTITNNHSVPTGEIAIGDSINTGVFTAKKYLKVHMKGVASSDISFKLQFNGDEGTTYSFRNSLNSATDPSPDTGASYLNVGTSFTGTANLFTDMDIINISNQEKLVIAETVGSKDGASNEMERKEFVGKWSNTASQISRIVATNSGSGNYNEGSSIIVYGTD